MNKNVLLVQNSYDSEIRFAFMCNADTDIFEALRRYVVAIAGIVPELGSQVPYQKWGDMPDILATGAENDACCAKYGITYIKSLKELKGNVICDVKTVNMSQFILDVCGIEPHKGWVLVQYDGSIRAFHVLVRSGLKDPLAHIGEYARKNGVGVWGDLMKLWNSAEYCLISTTSDIQNIRGEVFGYVKSKDPTPQLP